MWREYWNHRCYLTIFSPAVFNGGTSLLLQTYGLRPDGSSVSAANAGCRRRNILRLRRAGSTDPRGRSPRKCDLELISTRTVAILPPEPYIEAVLHGSIFCGKPITHPTKRTVDESGAESTEDLHFFYDAQSRPAFVEYNGVKYRYVHSL